jgi:hypothetical protein
MGAFSFSQNNSCAEGGTKMSSDHTPVGPDTTVDQDFAEGFRYGCLLIEFESVRARFELALKCGDQKLAQEIEPQLSAAMAAVQESHAQIMAKLQLVVDAMTAKKGLVN